MRSEDIFALGLGLTPPWEVSKVEFVQEPDKSKTLHIYIDFRKGGEFVYDAGQKQKIYGKEDKMWRHLNFFQQVLSPLPGQPHQKDISFEIWKRSTISLLSRILA